MADIDIRMLTTEAEKGHGDVLQATLKTVSFDEGLRILKQVGEQNQQDLQQHSTKTTLYVKPYLEKETRDMPARACVEVLYDDPKSVLQQQILYEELDMQTGKIFFSSHTTQD